MYTRLDSAFGNELENQAITILIISDATFSHVIIEACFLSDGGFAFNSFFQSAIAL